VKIVVSLRRKNIMKENKEKRNDLYVIESVYARCGSCLLSAVSTLRAQLIHKGFIYSANRGEVDFTVPQFDKFLKRIHGIS